MQTLFPMLLSSIYIATVTSAHGEETVSGITKITQDFGVNIPNIAAQTLSFVIVAFILWRFGFKPVLATLDERNAKIAAGLKNAEETQARLAAAAEESAQIVRNAQLEAQKSIEEARKSAKEFSDKQQAEAIARAADTLAKAQQAIELEHKKMLEQARTEIARLVIKTTEQVLAKKLTDADRAAYNDAAARELAAL
jgi:F-type H+-transporting ATPase subunit b